MTTVDPSGKRPVGPRLSPSTGVAIVFALIVGGLLREARWRGGLSSVAPSPLELTAEQL